MSNRAEKLLRRAAKDLNRARYGAVRAQVVAHSMGSAKTSRVLRIRNLTRALGILAVAERRALEALEDLRVAREQLEAKRAKLQEEARHELP